MQFKAIAVVCHMQQHSTAAQGPNQSPNPGPSPHPDQGQEASPGPDQTKHSEAIFIDLYHTMVNSISSKLIQHKLI